MNEPTTASNAEELGEFLLNRLADVGASEVVIRNHGLGPLAHLGGDSRFDSDHALSCLRVETRRRCFAEIVDTFSSAGIPVAPIKGMAYAHRLYPAPELRPMNDIDLLVPPNGFAEAGRQLRTLGFSVFSGARSPFAHAVTYERNQDVVDLHRNIAQPVRTRIDTQRLWLAAEQDRSSGSWRLDPIHEAIVHFVHIARTQGHAPGINYLDGALLLARMTVGQRARLDEAARRYRVKRALRFAVNMTESLFSFAPAHAPRWVPTDTEVLAHEYPRRSVQLLRKLMLVDSPVRGSLFAAMTAVERVLTMGRTGRKTGRSH